MAIVQYCRRVHNEIKLENVDFLARSADYSGASIVCTYIVDQNLSM